MLLNNKGMTVGYFIFFIVLFFLLFWYCYIMLYNNFKDISDENIVPQENNYEELLKSATEMYIRDYYSDLQNGENLIIKITTLKNQNYLINYDCVGYSIINKNNNSIVIEPYVKCQNYISKNYDNSYE